MPTFHEVGAKHLLSAILDEPSSAAGFAEFRQRIAADAIDPTHLAAIGQMFRYRPALWPLEQAAAFWRVHCGLGMGEYVRTQIEVGAEPAADKEREQNAAALADLPSPFIARVDMRQNCADQDGLLQWEVPIATARSTGVNLYSPNDTGWPDLVYMSHTVKPRSVPLEIGYTLPSRTLLHLMLDGAVARWPYGSTWIDLFVKIRQTDLGLRFDQPTERAAVEQLETCP